MREQQTDFFDIITLDIAAYMLKRFSKVTGLSGFIVSMSGKTAGSIYSRLHEEFYNSIKEENLAVVKNHFFKNIDKNEPLFYKTPSGLNYMGIAVKFKSAPIAILILEPFFYENRKPPDDFFIMQAQKKGFDLNRFLSAVEHVPVLVKNALDRIAYNCGNFSSMLTHILENKTEADSTREKLKTADTMLELLSYSADRLLAKTHVSHQINELLYRISAALGTDIILMCRTFKTREGKSILKTYWYNGRDEFFSALQNLTLDGVAYKEDLGMYYQRIRHGQQIFGSPNIFTGRLHSILKSQDVKTVLVTPVFSGTLLWGIIFFVNIVVKKEFSPVQFQTLEHIADIIGSALKRDHYMMLLNKNRKKYRLICENMSDLIWIMDTDFNITYVSPNSQKVLGYDPQEMASLRLDDLMTAQKYQHVMSELKNEFQKAQKGLIDKNYSRSLELEQLHKNGNFIWTDVKISFIFDKEKKPVSIIGITRDITERKQNQQLIEHSKRQMENTQKSSMEFLTGVAREIIPPLKTLLRAANQMKDQKQGRDISNAVNTIAQNGTGLTASLESILDLTMFKSGKEILDFKQFNLFDLIRNTVEKYKMRKDKKEIKFNLNYLSELPKNFKGDPVRIKQILSGLLANAVNHTQKGQITVTAEPDTSEKAALYAIRITVEDTGAGITTEKQKEISKMIEGGFFPDQENLNVYTTGLALVNVLARKMDGGLSFGSRPGKGSTFTVKIHLVAEKTQFSKMTRIAAMPAFENAKILLSLNAASDGKIAGILGNKFKCRVETVKTRDRLLEKAADKDLDMIIMDLPARLAGIETAQAIRGHLNPTVPIMVLTEEKLELDRYPGVDDCLSDYENSEKLRQKLVKWIKNKE
jgi:PAS domain S-box-containing protein